MKKNSNNKPLHTKARVVTVQDLAFNLGPQNQMLIPSIITETCGTKAIGSGFLVMPPARVAKPHIHAHSELIIFFLEGFGISIMGRDYEPLFVGPGDFLYIPAGEIHFGINLSETHRSTAIEIRTDPHFNEDVVLIPEMEEESIRIAAEYRKKFAEGTLDVPVSWKTRDEGPYKHKEVR
jgi:uncharacterized RmlC-like cupin family protein